MGVIAIAILLMLPLVLTHEERIDWNCVGTIISKQQSAQAKLNGTEIIAYAHKMFECFKLNKETYDISWHKGQGKFTIDTTQHKVGVETHFTAHVNPFIPKRSSTDVVDYKIKGPFVMLTGTDEEVKSIDYASYGARFTSDTENESIIYGNGTTLRTGLNFTSNQTKDHEEYPTDVAYLINAENVNVLEFIKKQPLHVIIADKVVDDEETIFMAKGVYKFYSKEGSNFKQQLYRAGTCKYCDSEAFQNTLNFSADTKQ